FQDVLYGLRILRKSPGFTIAATFTLALGIGACATIFSVVYGILLRPLPYAKPEQIVRLWEVNDQGHPMALADANFDDFRSRNHTLQGVAEFGGGFSSVSGTAEAKLVGTASVSRDFFSIMRVQPQLGRAFAPEDQKPGAAPAALVSYSYWQQSLGGKTDLSSVRIKIDDKVFSVIGVLPPGFHFPEATDVWRPRELFGSLPSRNAHNWRGLARLRDGVTLAQARADVSAIGRSFRKLYGKEIVAADATLEPLQDAMTGNVRQALLVLLGAVGFLLLVAGANVMNLMLAQAAAREGEIAVRTALGASRTRLVRQFLTESLLLATGGCALGVLLAFWGVQALLAAAPAELPRLDEVSVNLPVLLFAVGLAAIVAAGLGTVTALRATTGDPQRALAEGGKRQSGTMRTGRAIIALQMAVTLALLVGAGLQARSLLRVLSVDPGFRTQNIVTLDLTLAPAFGDSSKLRRVQFLTQLFDQLRAIPGMQEVGGTNSLPLGTGTTGDGTYVELNPQQLPPETLDLIKRSQNFSMLDKTFMADMNTFFEKLFQDKERSGYADYIATSEGYFRALGIPLLRGRLFNDSDTMDAPHVALLSDSAARAHWPGQDPVGHTIEFGNMDGDVRLLTIIGVVGDVREDSLEATPRPTIYLNYRQRPQKTMQFSVVMRTTAEPAGVLKTAREIVRRLDPDVPPRTSTFAEVFSGSLKTRRFNLILVGVFAVSALLLAMIGLYGVMAYWV
ncbi:MAG TPA: ABC transporter permease, partial [Alphaproteobacteria bacterium]|nr:ABC transporter permease [Alphaproteobacteria bacterium]